MNKRLLRPSPAMIVALVALSVALGGTATALSGSNTVFSDDIVDDEVYSADVRNDNLTHGGLGPADLRVGSVGTSEVLNDSATDGGLAASDLRPGSVGPSEATGLTGADIANAASGSDNVNADKLDGVDSSQLEGARAYALNGTCPGDPVLFCEIPRSKGVAYIVKVAEGTYCVGVDGINAADPRSIALVSQVSGQNHYWWATWKPAPVNPACVSQEFEVTTGSADGISSGV